MKATQLYDLTLTYTNDMRGVNMTQAKLLDHDGWNAKNLNIYSHAGTHMDAPIHFGIDGPTIDQIPVGDLMLDAWVVDATKYKGHGLIGIEVIEGIGSNFQPGEGLLICTNWSQKINTPAYRDALPRVSYELAQWCVERKVSLLGVEPPSVADVNNIEELTLIHHTLFKGQVIVVEGLCNLDKLIGKKVKLIALPLKVANGDGAPARVIAIDNTEASC
jgi:kynurenine formamidase